MRIKDNKGNAFTIVIIVLALFTIFVGMIFMQINNQIKSNKNKLESVKIKYAAEAGIESAALNIINQIEEKLDAKTTSNTRINTSVNRTVQDDFAKVKEKFISASEELDSLSVTNDELIICKQNLQNIIANKYTSPQDIVSDVVEFKLKVIHSVAIEKDNNIKNTMKTKVYSAIDKVNEGLILLYNSSIIHSGEEHKEKEIEVIDENGTKKIKPDYVKYEFMEDKEGQSKSEYKIKNLMMSAYGDGEDSLKQDMYRIKDSVHNVYNKQQWTESASKLNDFANNGVYGILGTYLNEKVLNDGTGSINFLSWQWNHDTNTLYEIINNTKKEICNKIDIAIDDKATKSLEKSFYDLYLTYFKDPELQSTQVYNDIITFLMNLEEVKQNLAELKCKFGGQSINIGGSINPPEQNEDTENGEIFIELDEYEHLFYEEYGYTVNKIDKRFLNVTYTGNTISHVDNLELEITSSGNFKGEKDDIKATVVFTTNKIGNEFVTDYYIKSYEKN